MKKMIGVLALLVSAILFIMFLGGRFDKAALEQEAVVDKKTKEQRLVRKEIMGSAPKFGQPYQRPEAISASLAKLIDEDPDYVAVVIGWRYVKEWESITGHVSSDILDRAEKDSASALMELKKFLVEEFTAYLIRRGYENPKAERVSWCNNNSPTAFLLIKLPVAERAGKKKELLRDICGLPSGEKGSFWEWISDYVPDEGKHSWYGTGPWPWKGEEPPVYFQAR